MIARRTDVENPRQGQLSARAHVRPFEHRNHPLSLDDHSVQIWVCEMANESVDDCIHHLSTAERERSTSYVMPRVRDQFIIGRSVLRRLLARYLQIDVGAVRISTLDNGKPILVDCEIDLHFNIAHSNGWALVALALKPVGIDIEVVRDVANAEGLVRRFFACDEQQQYELLPAELKRDGFLRGWTCKEAVLKATGDGMRAVDCCSVCLDPTKPPRLIQYAGRPAGEPWGLSTWFPSAEMIAAVAVQGIAELKMS